MTEVSAAVKAGASLERACEVIGISPRTLQRWRLPATAEDQRAGPRTSPQNKLTAAERKRVLEVANSEEFRNTSPNQIVPRLADKGVYVASESTMYRVLREEGQLTHRSPTKPRTVRPKMEHVASGPNQVWSWDITYLRGPVRGSFLYLYLVVDVFSRRIMGWDICEEESMEKASELILRTCAMNGVDPDGLVLHSDNGGPMKGSTMLATLHRLGIVASFSRPRVSDDNAYSEAMFRTLKYRPGYPTTGFDSMAAAVEWVRRIRRLVQRGAPPQRHQVRHAGRAPLRTREGHPHEPVSASTNVLVRLDRTGGVEQRGTGLPKDRCV